jgi:hypothetical protein
MKLAIGKMMHLAGCTIIVHKAWGTPEHSSFEVRGLKNSEKNRPQKVIFQFPESIDVQVGDFLQQKGARDMWRVVEVEDELQDDVYILFEARVEKATGNGAELTRQSRPSVVIQGHVYGGVQIDSPNANQHVSVQLLQVDENIRKLRELMQNMSVDELEREDGLAALERISQLARKPKTPDVIKKAKEKLELVKAMFDLAKDVGTVAAPYITLLANAFT